MIRGTPYDDRLLFDDLKTHAISGGAGDDQIVANGFLSGGLGDDTLESVGEYTTLRGGAGADLFILVGSGPPAVVVDFQHGVDTLGFWPGDTPMHVRDAGPVTLVLDSYDAVQFVVLGHPTITADDFTFF